jgi:hypothetical protein
MANARVKTASFGPGFLGVIIIFCVFALAAWIVISAVFHFASSTPTNEDKRADSRRTEAGKIAQESTDTLYSPAHKDAKGNIQLPIDVAMDLIVNDYQTKQVQASQVKVENPYPAGLQSPVAPAAPTAAAPSAATATGSNTGGAK